MNPSDKVERPHLLWWIAVIGGLTLLATQGFSPSFYEWWTATVNPLPSRSILAGIVIACIPIHLAEAIYCFRLSNRLGTPAASMGWAVQTFFIGFPSTRLIMKRARPAPAAMPSPSAR
jgi:hypothetical protein